MSVLSRDVMPGPDLTTTCELARGTLSALIERLSEAEQSAKTVTTHKVFLLVAARRFATLYIDVAGIRHYRQDGITYWTCQGVISSKPASILQDLAYRQGARISLRVCRDGGWVWRTAPPAGDTAA